MNSSDRANSEKIDNSNAVHVPAPEVPVVPVVVPETPATIDISGVTILVSPNVPALPPSPQPSPKKDATPALEPVTESPVVPTESAMTALLKDLKTKIKVEFSGKPISGADLVQLVPRFVAVVHLFSDPVSDKKALILSVLHDLVNECVPSDAQSGVHGLLDAAVPATIDAVLDVAQKKVLFPKDSWFHCACFPANQTK